MTALAILAGIAAGLVPPLVVIAVREWRWSRRVDRWAADWQERINVRAREAAEWDSTGWTRRD